MTPSCRSHRATVSPPLGGPDDALTALSLATDGGRLPCAVLACLDDERRPLTMFVLDGCPPDPSPLLLGLEVLLDAIDRHVGPRVLAELVLAISRPGASCAPAPGDGDAWEQFDELCAGKGIGLLDLFVLADGGANSVPAHLGQASRW